MLYRPLADQTSKDTLEWLCDDDLFDVCVTRGFPNYNQGSTHDHNQSLHTTTESCICRMELNESSSRSPSNISQNNNNNNNNNNSRSSGSYIRKGPTSISSNSTDSSGIFSIKELPKNPKRESTINISLSKMKSSKQLKTIKLSIGTNPRPYTSTSFKMNRNHAVTANALNIINKRPMRAKSIIDGNGLNLDDLKYNYKYSSEYTEKLSTIFQRSSSTPALTHLNTTNNDNHLIIPPHHSKSVPNESYHNQHKSNSNSITISSPDRDRLSYHNKNNSTSPLNSDFHFNYNPPKNKSSNSGVNLNIRNLGIYNHGTDSNYSTTTINTGTMKSPDNIKLNDHQHQRSASAVGVDIDSIPRSELRNRSTSSSSSYSKLKEKEKQKENSGYIRKLIKKI